MVAIEQEKTVCLTDFKVAKHRLLCFYAMFRGRLSEIYFATTKYLLDFFYYYLLYFIYLLNVFTIYYFIYYIFSFSFRFKLIILRYLVLFFVIGCIRLFTKSVFKSQNMFNKV